MRGGGLLALSAALVLLLPATVPASATEREQWTLRDVAPAVLEHFGI